MSDNLAKIRTIYNDRFPALVIYSEARFLREPIGMGKFSEPDEAPTSARNAIDAVGEAFGITFVVSEIANLVTIQSLVDLVDDRIA